MGLSNSDMLERKRPITTITNRTGKRTQYLRAGSMVRSVPLILNALPCPESPSHLSASNKSANESASTVTSKDGNSRDNW